MPTLRAFIDPAYALRRIKHYGPGGLVIDQVKRVPAFLPVAFTVVRAAKIAADPVGYSRRRRIAKALVEASPYKGFLDKAKAYRIAPPGTFEGVDRIIPIARDLYRQFLKMYPSGRINPTSYSYILFDYNSPRHKHNRIDLTPHVEFQDLATYRPFIEIACDYLGEVPIIGQLTYQVVQPNDDIEGFQKFHIDGGGNGARQVKIFIAVEEVDETNGATMTVAADKSAEMARSIGYSHGRIPDEVALSAQWKAHIQHAAGPAGTAFFFDTYRLVHCGARTRSRPRLLIMLQYLSKFDATESQLQLRHFDFDRKRAAADTISRLVFGLE